MVCVILFGHSTLNVLSLISQENCDQDVHVKVEVTSNEVNYGQSVASVIKRSIDGVEQQPVLLVPGSRLVSAISNMILELFLYNNFSQSTLDLIAL